MKKSYHGRNYKKERYNPTEEAALRGTLDEPVQPKENETTAFLMGVSSAQLAEHGAMQVVYPYYLESTMWLAITQVVDDVEKTTYYRPCNFSYAPWALKQALISKFDQPWVWIPGQLEQQFPLKNKKWVKAPAWKKYTAEEVVLKIFKDIKAYIYKVALIHKTSLTLQEVNTMTTALIYRWYGLEPDATFQDLIAHFRELNEPYYPSGSGHVLPVGPRYNLLSPFNPRDSQNSSDPGLSNKAKNVISAAIIAGLDSEGDKVDVMLSSINQGKIDELIELTKKA